MRNNLESDSLEQRRILGGIETGMVERIASIAADRFAMARSGIERQHGGRSGVFAKHVEHSALVRGREMEKAVPRQNSLERLSQRQRAHIADNPCVSGQAATTQRDKRRGRINAGDSQTLRCHVSRDRMA
jgi:hypothetical protein